ncbi:MAG: Ig-like domain-containing protein [Planctomycetes bacterium]|nr:Ig-like domain-containing protein [Planctomycetota bacterium]
MTMHPHATFFAKTFTAIALLLSFGLVGQTCSTQSPEEVLNPDGDGNGDGGGDGDGGGTPLPDQGPSAPEHGALILDGRPLILDAQPNAQIVDCHSVISIYYSESMKAKSIENGSFLLSEKSFGTLVSTSQSTWLMGNRLLIIEPFQPLLPNTTYQLTAAEGPVDLDGLAYDPGSSPVIIEFTTAATVDEIAPEILASYPLDSSINQPNDNQAVVVFSKQIDYTTISLAVDISNQTNSLPGDYDTNAGAEARHSGDRVFSFEHNNDGSDLEATINLNVSADIIADTSLFHMFMVDSYTSNWQTMSFQRPLAIQLDQLDFGDFSPAANLSNYQSFPLKVEMPATAFADDEVKLRIHQFDANHNDDARLVEAESVAGAGLVGFTLDLSEDVLGISTPVFEDESEMLLGAYIERNGVPTTVSLHLGTEGAFEAVPHDLVPPSLLRFGPPSGSFQSQFHCTLPIVRPYGVASEAIGEVVVNDDSRIVPLVSDDTFFMGKSFDPGLVTITGDEVPFALDLTDAAGNPSASPVNAVVHFSSFVGGTDLATSGGVMRVVAIDKQDLFPIGAATIHIEDFGGGNEEVLTSGSDGAVTFLERVGEQTVTIQRLGWQATTIIGVNASLISLPLTSGNSLPISVSPQIVNLNTGTSQISSNTLATSDGDSDDSMAQDYNLDSLFGGSVLSQPNQPGWFVSFHEVEDYTGGALKRYFEFVGLEKHVIVAPSTSSSAVVPVIEMAKSSNRVADPPSLNYIYSFDVNTTLLDFIPTSGSTSISTVIPGLKGPVVVGVGALGIALPFIAGAAELEINLLNEAQQEGASPGGKIRLNIYASNTSGTQVSFIAEDDKAPTPDDIDDPVLPNVPDVGSWDGTGEYPFTVVFDDTLSSSEGMYEITIFDSSPMPGVWNIIAMRSAIDESTGSFDLPSLLDAPGGPRGSIPLATDVGVSDAIWYLSVAAYEMAEEFSEIGFFFDVVKRDRISWAKSAIASSVVIF